MLARSARQGSTGTFGGLGLGTGVLLVALGAALWGTDGVLRVPLLREMSPAAIVLGEHVILLLYSVPAVVLGWAYLRRLRASGWLALLVIGWGGSALATLLFTAALAAGAPPVALLLQKAQPRAGVAGVAGQGVGRVGAGGAAVHGGVRGGGPHGRHTPAKGAAALRDRARPRPARGAPAARLLAALPARGGRAPA